MNRFFFVTLDTAIAATYRHLYRHLLTTQVIQRDGIACCDFVLAEHSGQIYPQVTRSSPSLLRNFT
jgi:hypothetical protein